MIGNATPVVILVSVLACVTGCATTRAERRNVEMRRRAEIGNMKADLRRLQDGVEGLAAGQEELHRRIEALQASSVRRQQGLDARIAEISRGLQGNAAEREQLKREVVDGLSKKMSAVMRAQAMRAPRAARGYEHVVEEGQTLSEIAAVYSVTTRAIVEANSLTNPDQIRAGQKLFIPE